MTYSDPSPQYMFTGCKSVRFAILYPPPEEGGFTVIFSINYQEI